MNKPLTKPMKALIMDIYDAGCVVTMDQMCKTANIRTIGALFARGFLVSTPKHMTYMFNYLENKHLIAREIYARENGASALRDLNDDINRCVYAYLGVEPASAGGEMAWDYDPIKRSQAWEAGIDPRYLGYEGGGGGGGAIDPAQCPECHRSPAYWDRDILLYHCYYCGAWFNDNPPDDAQGGGGGADDPIDKLTAARLERQHLERTPQYQRHERDVRRINELKRLEESFKKEIKASQLRLSEF